MVLIGCVSEIVPEQLSLIKDSSNKKKEEFIYQIQFALNQFLINFELEHPDNVLSGFVISEEVYEDGLTKNSLILSIEKIFKCKLECTWIIGKSFGGGENS